MAFAVRAAIVWLLTTGFLVAGGAEAGPTIWLPLILVGLMALLKWRDSRPLPPPRPYEPRGPSRDLTYIDCPFCHGTNKYNLGGGREVRCFH